MLIKKFSLKEALSRLTAEDGLSFRCVAQSKVLQQLFEIAKYLNFPSSHTTVREYVLHFVADVTNKFIAEIERSKSTCKFTFIMDEWTSFANRKYLNLVLMSKDRMWNLGLKQVLGPATALNLRNLIESKLVDFKMEFGDILSIVTDGAAVMTCLGTMLQPINQQLCFAHAIQLAVIKTLYKPVEQIIPNFSQETDSDEFNEDTDDLFFVLQN